MRKEGEQHLLLLMTGSDRDKLMRLVTSKAAPFYGSSVQEFPVLGRSYIDAMCEMAEENASTGTLNRSKMLRAFELFEHEPQAFKRALGSLIAERVLEGGSGWRIESRMIERAVQHRQDLIQRFP